MEVTHASIILPFPPSVNSLFRNVTGRDGKPRGRVVTKKYKAWREEAAQALFEQEPIARFTGPISLTLALGRPDKRKRDISNLVKAVEDLIVTHGIIADDSDVQRLSVYWTHGVHGCRVEIEPAGAVA